MNEKIKELQKAAGIQVVRTLMREDENTEVKLMLTESQLEKFVELIVRECADICNQAMLQNQDTLSKLGDDELAEKMIIHGSINQSQKLDKGIKEHFGVKE